MTDPSPTTTPLSAALEIHRAIDAVTYRMANLGSIGARRIGSLLLALETGEIDPAGALGGLDARDAEIVRRLALANLREVSRRLEAK